MSNTLKTRGLGWDDPGKAKVKAVLCVALLLAFVPVAVGGATTAEADDPVTLIIQETDYQSTAAEEVVSSLGGEVKAEIGIIEGFVATVPAGAVEAIKSDPSVANATLDSRVELLNAENWTETEFSSQSVYQAAVAVGALNFWERGYLGQGVDVALIDSGVAPVNGLSYPDKIVLGPDLSFESQNPELRYLDTYGHGTHMAGIIAGRDDALTGDLSTFRPLSLTESSGFVGIAPAARIVSVKVADKNGATDVSQILAAIDWVVQNKNANGLNIRVLNLSFGTDSTQSWLVDPLSFAVEQAWHSGILVVVAAGNDGNNKPLRSPASNPWVLAVGADDTHGTHIVSDNTVTEFSNCGNDQRRVDMVAPGKSIRSLRAPGSTADIEVPEARVDERFFKGSGTSQAAAMVSGAAALIFNRNPDATPDQVKYLLSVQSEWLPISSWACQGKGELDLDDVVDIGLPNLSQYYQRSVGGGTLEGARGTIHVAYDGVDLTGEFDILGEPFDSPSWTQASASKSSWSAGVWNKSSWSGDMWTKISWSKLSWSVSSWVTSVWESSAWSKLSWSSSSWSKVSWSATGWTDSAWS